MKTLTQIHQMDEQELVQEILNLQKMLTDTKVCQYKSSMIHTYHFAGNELLSCSRNKMIGSGLILTVHDISGKVRVQPTMRKDGLSNETINALLDDMQYSYDDATSFKPVVKRLK